MIRIPIVHVILRVFTFDLQLFKFFFFTVLFFFSSAKLFAFSHGLYSNIDAALQASGEDFFSTKNNFSSFDASIAPTFAPNSKNFYVRTAGIFAKEYHNYEINTVNQLPAGHLFIGAGAVFENEQNYFLNIGFGKKFNRRISSGFLLRPFFGKPNIKKSEGYHGGVSLNYSLRFQLAAQKRENVFALHSFETIFAVHNLGVSWFFPYQKEDSLLLGLQTQIIKHKNFSLLLLGKVGWRFATKNILWSTGTEFSVYFMRLRAGYSVDPYGKKNYLSFGLGGVYSWDENIFTMDYGISINMFPQKITAKDVFHSLAFSFAWNTVDNKAPQVKLQAKNILNANDTTWTLHNKLKERSPLADWHLAITNSKEKEIAHLQMDQRKDICYFTPLEYIKDFFSSKNRRHLPKKISWNFFTSSYSTKDYTPEKFHTALSIPTEDGDYYYKFFAQDEHGNKSKIQKGTFVIDTTPIKFGDFKTQEIFYANRKQRFFKLKVPIFGKPNDFITVRVYNAKEREIHSWQFALSNYRGIILWDTKDAKEGMYRIAIQATDTAKNISETSSKNFYLVKEKNIIGGSVNTPLLVPMQPPFVYAPETFTSLKIQRWNFTVFALSPLNKKKSNSKDNKQNNSKTIVYEKVGENILPKRLVWDGKIFSDKKANDGKYKMVFKVYTQDEVTPIKNETVFKIDTTPPKVVLHNNNYIIADADSYKDFFRFKLKVKDSSAIKHYRLRIFEKNENHSPVLVKQFENNNLMKMKPSHKLPKQLIWNTILPDGQQFLSFAKFYYDFFIEDQAGNKTFLKEKNLQSGINGTYKNNVFTFFIPLPSSQLDGRQRKIKTQKLYAKLRQKLLRALTYIFRYPDYYIKVEGHAWPTQSASQLLLHHEQQSLQLSEQLAYKVLKFFLARGISASRISFVGLGETEPLYQNQHIGNYGNHKNQRIGIILYKP